MYGRDYGGKTLSFEASGGLTNATLVLQDKETDTFWSLMLGEAVAGELDGEPLEELPISEKMPWKDWKARHPNTKVLSVNSRESYPNTYQGYFDDPKGSLGLEATDTRLATKAPVFAFRLEGQTYAAAYPDVQSGCAFELGEARHVFLFRDEKDGLFQSTSAFISKAGFAFENNQWREKETDITFDSETRSFSKSVSRLRGFDTFWYNWSLNNPGTELLQRSDQKP